MEVKGIWDKAKASAQAKDNESRWHRLFALYALHPPEDYVGLGRPSNTWRRPLGGIASIAQFSRWAGRNAAAERLVRLAIQHREQ